MQYKQYRFKFYINASHGIYLSGKLGELHPHTWEVILTVLKIKDGFSPFHEVEKMCEEYFSRYQDTVLNEIPPFTTINPTLENLTGFLHEEIHRLLSEKGWMLLSIEVSETPSRTFIINSTGDGVESAPEFSVENEEEIQKVIDRITERR